MAAYFLLVNHRVDGAEIKALEQRIDARMQVIAVLAKQVALKDTVYDLDTLRLTEVRRGLDSLALTLDEKVRLVIIQGIDKERAACDAVIVTCEERVAQRDSIIAHLDTVVAQKDSVIDRTDTDWKTKLGWLLVGVGVRSLIP